MQLIFVHDPDGLMVSLYDFKFLPEEEDKDIKNERNKEKHLTLLVALYLNWRDTGKKF